MHKKKETIKAPPTHTLTHTRKAQGVLCLREERNRADRLWNSIKQSTERINTYTHAHICKHKGKNRAKQASNKTPLKNKNENLLAFQFELVLRPVRLFLARQSETHIYSTLYGEKNSFSIVFVRKSSFFFLTFLMRLDIFQISSPRTKQIAESRGGHFLGIFRPKARPLALPSRLAFICFILWTKFLEIFKIVAVGAWVSCIEGELRRQTQFRMKGLVGKTAWLNERKKLTFSLYRVATIVVELVRCQKYCAIEIWLC